MKKLTKFIAICCFLISCAHLSVAQEISGIVFDLESSAKLRGIVIKNLNNNEQTETDHDGTFKIKGNINDYLRLSGGGYDTDTVFIYDEGIRRIFLVKDQNTIVINEVYITRFTDSRLAAEISKAKREGQAVEANQERGGLRISPSRLFGKQGKKARSNLQILLNEQEYRKIDKVFTNQLIRSTVPLAENEITFFKETYRPSFSFIENATREQLIVYISESYTTFRKNNPAKN